MKVNDYTDLRIQKTKDSLFRTLFENLADSTKNLQKIKVLDICEQANITPMTFYKHYENKEEFIEDAIKNQIGNRLPIPIKMKPHNLKQLIYYLLGFFEEYVNNHKNEISNAVIYAANKGYKNTYIDILFKLIMYYVKKEINLLNLGLENLLINIWSEFIVGGLFYLYIKRIIYKQIIQKSFIFDSIKRINCLFN